MNESTPTTSSSLDASSGVQPPKEPSVRPHLDTQSAMRLACLAVVAYLAFDLLLPLIRIPRHGLRPWMVWPLIFGPTAMFMLLQIWLSRSLAGLRPRAVVCVIVTALAVALWFMTYATLHPYRGWPFALNYAMALLRPVVLGLTITFACTFFGILLSRIVREANVLLPVALIAIPIDYLGAMTPIGFTHDTVTKHPNIVQAVSVPVPTVGGLHPIAFIGPGDALFMAFFFAVVLRLGLNIRGTFWWMYGLLTVAMLLVLSLPNFNVAALVPMGLAVLIANGRSFRLKREEVFAVLYASVLVLVLVVAFYLYSHAHFFRHSGGRA